MLVFLGTGSLNTVVLKNTFDQLVEQIWCKKHMNIGTWEAVSVWLWNIFQHHNCVYQYRNPQECQYEYQIDPIIDLDQSY